MWPLTLKRVIVACVFVAVVSLPSQTQAQAVPYEVVRVEDTSHKAMGGKSLSDFTSAELARLPTDKRLQVRVVVPDTIQRNQVRPVVEAILVDLRRERPDVDEIGLLVYSDSALVDGAYDVARATWSTNGELGGITPRIARENVRDGYETNVQIKKDLESYLAQRARQERKGGLSESERREIFRALVRSEDRARIEAERRYPTNTNCVSYEQVQENMDRNLAVEDSLREAYEREVREEYGITESVADSISVEGLSESWRMPEMSMPECP